MGTLRLQPARVGAFTSKAVSNLWSVFDVQLAFYALGLTVIGLLLAYTNSAAAPLASGSVFGRALMWLALGIMAFTLAASIDYRWFRSFAWPIYFVNIGLLGVTLAIGSGVGGASRWVSIMGLQFQFSELAKIVMAIVIARFLTSRGERVGNLWTILGAGLIVAPPLALVLIQPDLGSSLVFGAIVFGALFVSGASIRWLAVVVVAGLASIPFVWNNVLADYQRLRLIRLLDPSSDTQGSLYQVTQSQIAVGSGGLFGKGLTNGAISDRYLPVNTTDFAYASLGEQLGFLGSILVLVLFGALIWRVLLIGWRSKDPFGLAFAAGIASMLLFQVLVNVGMVIGLMPVTGIPLPFITHGGASLISIAFALGVLQSINMRQDRPNW
ncbi:MAG: rod shape determining protein RodA [Chloroflexota bacterium]|jgi:rod shape determining protein RodA|nr:rod shape determining protein RodA [Chloroflexota bacterium]